MTTTVPAARPRTPRRTAVVIAIALAAALALLGAATPAFANDSGTLASLVNRDRAAHGLRPLARSGALDAVALNWAHHMADSGRMSHNPSLAAQVPGGWRALGENVAMGQPSPQAMETAWMNSPGHRANILGDYTHVGVAFLIAKGQIWGVEVFAKYPTASTAQTKPAAKPKPTAPKSSATPATKPKPTGATRGSAPKPKPAPARPAPRPAPARPEPAATKPTPTPSSSPRPASSTTPEASLVSAAPSASPTPVVAVQAADSHATSPGLPLGVAAVILAAGAAIVGVVRRRRT